MFLKDINECAANNGGCEDICINGIGSFRCQCGHGHVLDYNGRTCSGIIKETMVSYNSKRIEGETEHSDYDRDSDAHLKPYYNTYN